MSPIRPVLAIVAAMVFVGIALPADAAESDTGTATIHLLDGAGQPLIDQDSTAVVAIVADRAPFYHAYASSKKGCALCTGVAVGPPAGGVATFRGLPTGQVLIASVDLGPAFPSGIYQRFTLAPGASESISLTAAALGEVSGTVRARDGSPAAGRKVAAIDSHGRTAGSAYSGDDGTYRIVGLRSGAYRIEFNASPLRDLSGSQKYAWSFYQQGAPVVVEEQSAAHAVTRLTGVDGVLVRGYAVAPHFRLSRHAKKYDEVRIDFLGESGANLNGFIPGSAAAVRLPPGRYTVRIQMRRDAESDEPYSQAFYYAGAGKKSTMDVEKAATITVTDHDRTVELGLIPDRSG